MLKGHTQASTVQLRVSLELAELQLYPALGGIDLCPLGLPSKQECVGSDKNYLSSPVVAQPYSPRAEAGGSL